MVNKVLREALYIPEEKSVIFGFREKMVSELFKSDSPLFRWFRIGNLVPKNEEEKKLAKEFVMLKDDTVSILLNEEESNFDSLYSLFQKIFSPAFEELGVSIKINEHRNAFLLYSLKKKITIDYLPKKNILFLPIFYAENLNSRDFYKGLLVGLGVLQFFFPRLRGDLYLPSKVKVNYKGSISLEVTVPFVPFWETYFKVLAFRDFTEVEKRLWESIYHKEFPLEYVVRNGSSAISVPIFNSFYSREKIREKIIKNKRYKQITISRIKEVVKISILLEELLNNEQSEGKSEEVKREIVRKLNSYVDRMFFLSILKEFLLAKKYNVKNQKLNALSFLFAGKENVSIDRKEVCLSYKKENWNFVIHRTDWFGRDRTVINTRKKIKEKDESKEEKKETKRRLIL